MPQLFPDSKAFALTRYRLARHLFTLETGIVVTRETEHTNNNTTRTAQQTNNHTDEPPHPTLNNAQRWRDDGV